MKANITDIQHFALYDGPGIRTMVFFAGCGMRCAWCQNPEALENTGRLMYNERLCIGCAMCVADCPNHAISVAQDGRILFDRSLCQNCFTCTERCYSQARKPSSYKITLEDLMREVLADKVFYRQSGGGVTLSGGEALLQIGFAEAFLRKLKEEDVHTAIETAGYYPTGNLLRVLPFTDMILFDIKLIDSAKHARFTGVDNTPILKNFECAAKSTKVIVRVPLIPNVNDGDEFYRIVDFVAGNGNVDELHILPFHQIGDEKYTQAGMKYTMQGVDTENEKGIERCREIALKAGFKVSVGGRGFC